MRRPAPPRPAGPGLLSRIGAAMGLGASASLAAEGDPWAGPGPAVPSGGFEATRSNRRLRAYVGTGANLNSLIAAGGETLRRRAEEAGRNNPYAVSACDSYAANLVGTGIKPSSLVADPGLRRAMNQLWTDCTDELDADGATDAYGQQALAARAMFWGGEMFARFRPRRPEDGLLVPLQVQLLGAAMLPLELNRRERDGHVTRMGIEFDAIGRRVAYWFRRHHPGDFTLQDTTSEFTRVPAADVCHVYRQLEPGQIRGIPRATASLVRLYLLDGYDDAELERKRLVACQTMNVYRGEPGDYQEGDEDEPDEAGQYRMAPGWTNYFAAGESSEIVGPAEVGGSYEPFQYRNLLASAAGMGVTYPGMTGDRRQTSYSSDRGDLVEKRRRYDQELWSTIVFQLCRPLRRRWLDASALSGALAMPGYAARRAEYGRTKHIPQPWAWVDPLKDRKAQALAEDYGWISRDDNIEGEGSDPEETDARIVASQERERGFPLPLRRGGPAAASDPAAESPGDQGAEAA